MNDVYTQKVEVLLKIIPIIAGEEYSEFEDTRWNLIKSEESRS